MKRTLQAVFLAIFAAEALVVGQGAEVKRVLSEIRAALGGEARLAAVKTIAVEGQTTVSGGDGSSTVQDFEMAFEFPVGAIRFMKKNVLMNLGNATISRRTGFNGNELIDEVDTPPSMGGSIRMMRMSPGGPIADGQATPDQIAAQKAELLLANRREFARLALGMFGSTTSAYPVEFAHAGQADSPGGKADVLDVKAADGFSARLFVDRKTHLPLMLTWMDKEPLRMTGTVGGGTVVGGGGVVRTFTSGGAAGQSPPDPAVLRAELAARTKEAEANRKTVEYRVFYADYKSFDGVRLPTRIQYMRDGLPTEEMNLGKITLNGTIDASMFAVVK